jgi:hypothetical protein
MLAASASLVALVSCAASSSPPQASTTTLSSALTRTPAPNERHVISDPAPVVIVDSEVGSLSHEEWQARFPIPARELDLWARHHRMTASKIEDWSHSDPDHARVLVMWAITHPYEDLGSFLLNHQGWDTLQDIRKKDAQALVELIEWCRRSPRAAEEYVLHSTGFASFAKYTTSPVLDEY